MAHEYPFQKAYSITQKADANMGINRECNEACGNAHINCHAVRLPPHICVWVHTLTHTRAPLVVFDRHHLYPGSTPCLPPSPNFLPRLQRPVDEALC